MILSVIRTRSRAGVLWHVTRTVDNHIAKLRQKIETAPADPEYLITIHGIGYKFLG
jgi:DNA-binding response OmpR family regulator